MVSPGDQLPLTGAVDRARVVAKLDAILNSLDAVAAPVPLGLRELRDAIARGQYDVPAPVLSDASREDLVAALKRKEGVESVDTPADCQLGVWILTPNGGRHRYAESRLLDAVGGGTVLRVKSVMPDLPLFGL